jgi:allophanate hydrolase subunit 1
MYISLRILYKNRDYREETIKMLKKARNAAENKKAKTKIIAVIMCWKGKSANQIAKD